MGGPKRMRSMALSCSFFLLVLLVTPSWSWRMESVFIATLRQAEGQREKEREHRMND